MAHPIKYLIILFILIYLDIYAQISKQDIRDLLIVQGNIDITEIEVRSEYIYNQLLDKKSFKFNDFIYAFGMSALSGIGQGAYESNNFGGYDQIDWMPESLQKWYMNSTLKGKEPNYKLFNWQMVFRETDYICDRIAYEKLNVFFKNQWYWAFLVNWVVKNTFATITRDQFLSDRPFQSFRLDLVIPIFN